MIVTVLLCLSSSACLHLHAQLFLRSPACAYTCVCACVRVSVFAAVLMH